MDSMLDAARCVHTSGFVLPVAAVALIAVIPRAAIPTSAGARRLMTRVAGRLDL
jgi:hypothetical protein